MVVSCKEATNKKIETEVQNKLTVLPQVQQVAECRTASYRCYRAPQDEFSTSLDGERG
jgi:hypothetical protein